LIFRNYVWWLFNGTNLLLLLLCSTKWNITFDRTTSSWSWIRVGAHHQQYNISQQLNNHPLISFFEGVTEKRFVLFLSVGRCAKSITTQTHSIRRIKKPSRIKYEFTFTMQSEFDIFHSSSIIKWRIPFIWILFFFWSSVITIDFIYIDENKFPLYCIYILFSSIYDWLINKRNKFLWASKSILSSNEVKEQWMKWLLKVNDQTLLLKSNV
jgi:hypothetical protein